MPDVNIHLDVIAHYDPEPRDAEQLPGRTMGTGSWRVFVPGTMGHYRIDARGKTVPEALQELEEAAGRIFQGAGVIEDPLKHSTDTSGPYSRTIPEACRLNPVFHFHVKKVTWPKQRAELEPEGGG